MIIPSTVIKAPEKNMKRSEFRFRALDNPVTDNPKATYIAIKVNEYKLIAVKSFRLLVVLESNLDKMRVKNTGIVEILQGAKNVASPPKYTNTKFSSNI